LNSELEEKTKRIGAMLESEHLDAVLLNSQHNFAWLTGGGSNGVDLSRPNGVASLLVTRLGRRFILANVIELERMLEEEVSEGDFEPVEYSWQAEKAAPEIVFEKAGLLLEKGARIGSDVVINPETPVVEKRVAPCRYQLTINELERFRAFGRDAGAALRQVIPKLNPGETESQIAEKMRHELGEHGILSVVTLVAADERISKFRHPVPTQNRWRKTLLTVTCAKRHGLIASLSRLICIGEVPDELKKKTEAAAYVNAVMLNATRPGATGSEVYQAAAMAYAEIGFADEINRHHQGGATGYLTREWVAHPKSAECVHANQAFAWNPSITGTKVEETCVTAESGVEVITASPDFPQIANVIDGREYLSPGILTV